MEATASGRRIWHQSYTDISTLPVYAERLSRHANLVLGPDSSFELHGLPHGTPVPAAPNAYLERLLDLQVCDAVIEAEQQGYAAVSIGCWNDPALREARSLVRIPVLGLAETAMLVACPLGRTFGLISLNRSEAALASELAQQYGHGSRAACSIYLDPEITEVDIENARDAAARALMESFQEACFAAEERGAEVIIPAEGVLNEFLVSEQFVSRGSAVVLDVLGILWAQTECFIEMRRSLGLEVSRRELYRKAGDHEIANLVGFVAKQWAGRYE